MNRLCALMLALGFVLLANGPARAALILSQDIGTGDPMDNPAIPGGFTYDEQTDTYTVTGGGSDIWGNADHGHFVYEQIDGDCTITAKVISITGGTDPWAKAGVMIRNTLQADDVNAAMVKGRANPFNDQRRTTVGGAASRTDPRPAFGASGSLPMWMELNRTGNVFTYSLSKDGVSWFEYADTPTLLMTEPVYVGLAVTAHNNNQSSTGVFRYVEILAGPSTTLYWDEQGDGRWGESEPDSNWVDDAGDPAGTFPDDHRTHAVINTDMVTAAADRAARSVTVGETTPGGLRIAGSPDPDPGATLRVTEAVNVGVGSTLTFGNNATLVARGGTIDRLHTGGNAALSHGGDFRVTSFDDQATRGTFTKQGDGILSLDNTSGNAVEAGATTFLVADGTLKSAGADPLGGAPKIILAGGTVELSGRAQVVETPNALLHAAYMKDGRGALDNTAFNFDNNGGLLAERPAGTALFTNGPGNRGLDFNNDADWRAAVPEITRNDDYQNVISGRFNPPADGDYSFKNQQNDNRGGIWLDLDRDGVFQRTNSAGADERICWEQPGQNFTFALLGDGLGYPVAFVHGEHGGGSGVEMRLSTPTLNDVVVKPGDAAQAGLWTAVETEILALEIGHTAVDVTADSTLNARTDFAAQFGPLTLQRGLLTTIGAEGGVGFAGTSLAQAAEGTVGVNVLVETRLGVIDGNSTEATFLKRGPVDLLLDQLNVGLQAATFEVQEGRLIGAHGFNSFNNAALQISGGELVLSSPGGDVLYDDTLTVEADGRLTLSAAAGQQGPLSVTLGNQSTGIALGNGTLSVQAIDDYGLYVPGTIAGSGNLNLTAGNVTVDNPIRIGSLGLVGGTLTRTGQGTPAGNISLTGDLTLQSDSLNMIGSTLSTTQNTRVTVAQGRFLSVDDPLVVAELSNAGTVTAPGITAIDIDILAGGLVDSSAPITADNLNISGVLELTGTGQQRNVTIRPGGSLYLEGSNLDLEEADLSAAEATVIIGFGRTLTCDKALTVGSLDTAGTLSRRGAAEGSRDVTITPGGSLKLSSGAILNMTGLTSGTLTTTGCDVVVDNGVLKVANELRANDVTVTAGRVSTTAEMTVNNMTVTGGRVNTNDAHVTVNNRLTLGDVTGTISEGDTFTASGSDLLKEASLTLGGGTLTFTPATYFPSAALLANWTFDNPADPGHDDSGNGRDLQLRNGAAYDPAGRYGGALVFDGNDDDAIDADAGGYLNDLSGLTVAMWVKADAIGVDRGFWECRDGGDADEWGARYDDAGASGSGDNVIKVGLTFDTSGGNANRNLDQQESSSGVQTANWQHVACVWEDGLGFKMYLDTGLDTPTSAMQTTAGKTAMVNRFTIGNGTKDYWDGMIDDVYVYGRALSEDELRALYAHQFAFLPLEVPNVHLELTDSTTIEVEGNMEGTYGNLILAGEKTLTIANSPGSSFHDVTTTGDATIIAPTFVRGVLSPGGSGGIATLTVGGLDAQGLPVGGFELGDSSQYVCEVSQSMANDQVVSTADAFLSGSLTLRALSKLEPPDPQGVHWYGDQTRSILSTIGESGIAYTFLDAPENREHLGHGVFATDEGRNGQVVTYGLNAVEVDLFQAANGDVDGDREVGSADVQKILGANTFPDRNPADWESGDFNADGWCNSADVQLLLAANLFDTGPYAAPQPAPPVEAAVRLILTPAAGGRWNVRIDAGGLGLSSYRIESAEAALTGEDPANLGLFTEDDDFVIAGAGLGSLLGGVHDLGAVLGPGGDGPDGLRLTYTVQGAAGLYRGEVVLVPEPGGMVVLITGALGLLLAAMRRRRPA